MKNIKNTFRTLLRDKQNSIIKILSLSIGLAIGLVLLAKASFDLSFDNFYPDSDRVYVVTSNYISLEKSSNGEARADSRVSGAVPVGMKAEIPEIESATRFVHLYETVFFIDGNKNLKNIGKAIVADSNFFDVLPRKMIIGNAKDILSKPMHAMISESMAKKLGKDILGKHIELERYANNKIQIAGIFEDIPANSTHKYNIIISFHNSVEYTGANFDKWVGNERFYGYVKLIKGTKVESLAPQIRQVQVKHQDIEKVKSEKNLDITYSLIPIDKAHYSNADIMRSIKILSILSVALLVTAMMNYILFAISSIVERSKNIAIHKCYGADNRNIGSMIFVDTFVSFFIATLVAILIIVAADSLIKNLLGVPSIDLFNLRSCIILLGVLFLTMSITALVPISMFSNLPVLAVLRVYKKTRRGWKLALLFVQFVTTIGLFVLLAVVSLQYNLMVKNDVGYEHKNVVDFSVRKMSNSQIDVLKNELKDLPEVEYFARKSSLYSYMASGNYVLSPDDEKTLFLGADLEYCGENILDAMSIKLVGGKGFDQNSAEGDMMISEAFAKKMKDLKNIDNMIGENLTVTGADYKNPTRVVGIYKDFQLSSIKSIKSIDSRPSMMFFAPNKGYRMVVKLKNLNAESLQKITDIVHKVAATNDISVTPYSNFILDTYKEELQFRNLISIGCIVTLLIALIGLIGYINNEIQRRSSEIAVRKINGATMKNIVMLFIKDISKLMLPATLVGLAIAYYLSTKWLENFPKKIDVSVILLAGCALPLLTIVMAVVLINCIKIANQNPVDSLKSE